MANILIVDDDVSIVESLKFALRKEYNLFLAHNSEEAMKYFEHNDIDVSILDLKLGDDDGMVLFNQMRDINPKAIAIMITAYGTIKSSVDAIKSGVFQYLTKPIDLSELKFNIEKGVQVSSLHREVLRLEEENLKSYHDLGIYYQSVSMKEVLKTVEKIKDIDTNVLITGESGTGKGVIARAIHKRGNRKNERFYTLNCAAIPKELLESELFGYKKGAFTGAVNDKKGLFELSKNGTLFLDEIGDMDLALQGKLLNVIQEKKIMPVGAEKEIDVDVRLIAATNKNLRELVKNNQFRDDLYYRINVININMPPLRDRKDDIPLLINYFIEKYAGVLNKEIRDVSEEFIDTLVNYDFQGNIRELENYIERAIALTDGDTLKIADFNKGSSRKASASGVNILQNSKLIPVFVGETIEEIERKVIEATYEVCGYNQQKTAKLLGITDRTIRNKLKRYRTH